MVRVFTEGGSIKDTLTKHCSYSAYFAILLIVYVI